MSMKKIGSILLSTAMVMSLAACGSQNTSTSASATTDDTTTKEEAAAPAESAVADDVDVSGMAQTVIPTRGAVVRAKYNASVGSRVLMTVLRQGGATVPFGAMVTDLTQNNSQGFIVGEEGQVYLTGLANKGALHVQWGKDAGEQCEIHYSLPESKPESGVLMVNTKCQ